MKDAEILMLCKAQLVAILDSDSPLSEKQDQASKLGTKLRQQLRKADHSEKDAIDLSVRVVGVAVQEHIQRLKDEGKLNGGQA